MARSKSEKEKMSVHEKHRREAVEKAYSEELYDAVNNLKNICKKHKYPMVVSICMDLGNPEIEDKAIYKNEVVSPFSLGVKIEPTSNYIAEFFKIINGFHAVPNEMEEIDSNEFNELMKEFMDL